MRIRPLADTVTDTLQWHLKRPANEQAALRAGVKAEREAEVLAAWDAARA
jgi:2'-hydroxyisoflavone reductase